MGISSSADCFFAAPIHDKENSTRNTQVFILDGAMDTQLQSKGLPNDPNLSTLLALIDEQYHSLVIASHKEYLKAGATIITTNTSHCVPSCIDQCAQSERWPFDSKPDCAEMIRLAVNLANTARTEFIAENGNENQTQTQIDSSSECSNPLIAASIPPLMVSCNSQTTGTTGKLTESESIVHYDQIIGTLKDTNIDLFLVESISTFKEATYVLSAMIRNGLTKSSEDGRGIYLFFKLRKDGKLKDGMDFNKMMSKLKRYLDVLPIVMVGANGCTPAAFEMMMEGISKRTVKILKEKSVAMGCYPNGVSDVLSKGESTKRTPGGGQEDEDTPEMKVKKELHGEVMYTKYYKEWIKRYSNEEYRFGLIGGYSNVSPSVIEYAAKNVKGDFPEMNGEENEKSV